ncbi:MAG: FtsX-like permease family protein, partial [Terriglobales bacterium]
AGSPRVAVVNQRMAETFWPGQNPLGHQVQPGESGPWATVIGEVADVKNKGVDQAAGTELYLPLAQAETFGVTSVYILTRSRGLTAGAQVAAVRGLVERLDAALPLAQVASMDEVLSHAEARPRLLTLLLLLFAAAALALAAVGIYGVMSYAVGQRRREFGLRSAIGASPGDLLRLVLGQGCALAGMGIAIGVALALAASSAVRGLVFGVAPTDPTTLAAVALVLGAVAVAACWIPARRAMQADPMAALREE